MTVSVRTKSSFQGRMYVEGFPYDSRCSIPYGTYNSSNLVMSVPLVPCVTSFSHNGSVAYVRISTHPVFVTTSNRLLRLECRVPKRSGGSRTAACAHEVHCKNGRTLTDVRVGDHVLHKWSCPNNYSGRKYVMVPRKCDVLSETGSVFRLIDESGCSTDERLMRSLEPSQVRNELVVAAFMRAFKFPDTSRLRFRCSILILPRPKDMEVDLPKCGQDASTPEHIHTTLGTKVDDGSIEEEFDGVEEVITLSDWIYVREDKNSSQLFDLVDYLSNSSTGKAESDFELASSKVRNASDIALPPTSIDAAVPVSKVAFLSSGCNHTSCSSVPSSLPAKSPEPTSKAPFSTADNHWPPEERHSIFSNEIQEPAPVSPSKSGTTTTHRHVVPNSYAPKVFNSSYFTRRSQRGQDVDVGCTWQSVNVSLLLWSLGSVIVWLILVGLKLYEYVWAGRASVKLSSSSGSPKYATDWNDPYNVGFSQGTLGRFDLLRNCY